MFLPLTTSEALRRRPILVGALIAICVVVFVWPESHTKVPEVLAVIGPRPPDYGKAFVSFDEPSHLLTYAFMHGSWTHRVGNMFFLWTFGRLIEAHWGRLLTLLCFLVCAAAGATLHALAHPDHSLPLVGASGAIAGLAGAVVVALPNACHVGGALAGIGVASAVRSARLPARIDALFGVDEEKEDVRRASDPALAPALRTRREADRPSQFPTGRFAAGWFVLSIVAAVGLMIGTSVASERLGQLHDARETAKLREKLLATPALTDAPLDARYDSPLVSVTYPASFWACGEGRSATGPCAQVALPSHKNVTYVDILRPDALESIEVIAIRGGIEKRSEMVDALVNEIASRASTEHQPWTLLETHNGTCRGPYSVESVLEIGRGEHRLRLWACSFGINRDVYLFAYVLPDSLRERDQATFDRIFKELTLPAERPTIPITVASASPPPPVSVLADPQNDGRCRPDQSSYRVGGVVRCYDAPEKPAPRTPSAPPRRR